MYKYLSFVVLVRYHYSFFIIIVITNKSPNIAFISKKIDLFEDFTLNKVSLKFEFVHGFCKEVSHYLPRYTNMS